MSKNEEHPACYCAEMRKIDWRDRDAADLARFLGNGEYGMLDIRHHEEILQIFREMRINEKIRELEQALEAVPLVELEDPTLGELYMFIRDMDVDNLRRRERASAAEASNGHE